MTSAHYAAVMIAAAVVLGAVHSGVYRFVGGGVSDNVDGRRGLRMAIGFGLWAVVVVILGYILQGLKMATLYDLVSALLAGIAMHLGFRTGEVGHLYCVPPVRQPNTAYGKFTARLGSNKGMLLRLGVQPAVVVFCTLSVIGMTPKPALQWPVIPAVLAVLAGVIVLMAYGRKPNSTHKCSDTELAEYVTGAVIGVLSVTAFL